MSRNARPDLPVGGVSVTKIRWLRSFVWAGSFLLVGFYAGRLFRPVVVEPRPAAIITSVSLPAGGLERAPEPSIAPVLNRLQQGAESSRDSVDPQLATLRRWMKTGFYYVGVVFEGDRLNPSIALLLGLSPTQLTELEMAVHRAAEKLNQLRISRATATLEDQGRRLVVSVPSLGAEGSAVYAELLGTISAMLGPEHMRFFDRMAGRSLERAFDGYGLEAKRYEFIEDKSERSPAAPGVVSLVVTSFDGKAEKTSGSTWFSLADLPDKYPFATRFLPPGFGRNHPVP